MKIPLVLLKPDPRSYWPKCADRIVDTLLSTGGFKLQSRSLLCLEELADHLDTRKEDLVAFCSPRMPDVSAQTMRDIQETVHLQRCDLLITANRHLIHPILLKVRVGKELVSVDAEGIWRKRVSNDGFEETGTSGAINVYRRQDYPELIQLNYFLIIGNPHRIKKFQYRHRLPAKHLYIIDDSESTIISSEEDERFHNLFHRCDEGFYNRVAALPHGKSSLWTAESERSEHPAERFQTGRAH